MNLELSKQERQALAQLLETIYCVVNNDPINGGDLIEQLGWWAEDSGLTAANLDIIRRKLLA